MTQELDINTLASWATVAVAAAAGVGFFRKGSRWFEQTDERLKTLETGQTKLEEGQASAVADLAQIKGEQTSTQERLDSIDAQLRPNGGGSHHDVIRREIREALEEAADSGRRHWRR